MDSTDYMSPNEFTFLFEVNKSYRNHSSHPITIPKKHYDHNVFHEMSENGFTDVVVSVERKRLCGYIYSGNAGFGPYYQLRMNNDNFSKVPVSCVDAERIVVGVGLVRDSIVISFVNEPGCRSDERRAPTLSQNPVNSINNATTIGYTLHSASGVVLEVYDLTGQRVRRLLDHHHEAGRYQVTWDGLDEGGLPLPGGVYLLKVETFGADKICEVVPIENLESINLPEDIE